MTYNKVPQFGKVTKSFLIENNFLWTFAPIFLPNRCYQEQDWGSEYTKTQQDVVSRAQAVIWVVI